MIIFIAARVFLSYTWTCTPPTLAPSIWRGGSDARPSATPWRTHIRSPVIAQIVSGLVFSDQIIGLYSKGMQYLLRGVVQWRLGWGSWSVPPVSTRQSWVTLKTAVCGFPQSFGSSSPCSALTELVLKEHRVQIEGGQQVETEVSSTWSPWLTGTLQAHYYLLLDGVQLGYLLQGRVRHGNLAGSESKDDYVFPRIMENRKIYCLYSTVGPTLIRSQFVVVVRCKQTLFLVQSDTVFIQSCCKPCWCMWTRWQLLQGLPTTKRYEERSPVDGLSAPSNNICEKELVLTTEYICS